MQIELRHIAPIELIVEAIRECHDSMANSDSITVHDYENINHPEYILGPKDKALIQQVIKFGHESTLEHCQVTFRVRGFSRAVLQELARHRIGTSPSVKSTRFTLKELKNEASFWPFDVACVERAKNYLIFTGNDDVDMASVRALEGVRELIAADVPNDYAKYALPESYMTSTLITFNIRSFRHFLKLRKSSKALWEIRMMAGLMEEEIPEIYKFMLE